MLPQFKVVKLSELKKCIANSSLAIGISGIHADNQLELCHKMPFTGPNFSFDTELTCLHADVGRVSDHTEGTGKPC